MSNYANFHTFERLQLRHYSVIGVNFGQRLELIRVSPKLPLHVKISLGVGDLVVSSINSVNINIYILKYFSIS